jgi:hypothetical protein
LIESINRIAYGGVACTVTPFKQVSSLSKAGVGISSAVTIEGSGALKRQKFLPAEAEFFW